MFKLRRLNDKPVLTPIEGNVWERAAVFNTGVLYENGEFHLFYRASDNSFFLGGEKPDKERKFTSSIGHAVSKDGINFSRYDMPLLTGIGPQEAWGMEDPRITKIDDTYYMVYAGFGGRNWTDVRVSMVSSKDLKSWEGHKVLLPGELNKDAALLPEKKNGKYFLFHRRIPSIWTATSADLANWEDHKVIMEPRKGKWDCEKIGLAGTPVKIEEGWLMIYHGVDKKNVYRLGAALLDENDPNKVLAVQDEPILEPEAPWETNGLVPNVVFSCGACIADGFLYVYYGSADTVIGVAGIEVSKIKF